MMTFPIYGKIKHVPNHQPETDLNLVLTHFPPRLRLQSRAPAFPPNSCPGPDWAALMAHGGNGCLKNRSLGGDFKSLINHENVFTLW
jgi:hypothetical protein